MTDIRLSLDVDGVEEILRVNDELMDANARLEREIAIRDDNNLLVACLAVGSVLVTIVLSYCMVLHAVTVHGLFKGVTR